jgi:hypothetical protein
MHKRGLYFKVGGNDISKEEANQIIKKVTDLLASREAEHKKELELAKVEGAIEELKRLDGNTHIWTKPAKTAGHIFGKPCDVISRSSQRIGDRVKELEAQKTTIKESSDKEK